MSKQTATIKSSGIVLGIAASEKKPRSTKVAKPVNADFWQGYEEWQPVKAHPAKRRAYIKKLCRRIAEEFHPEKIILFGSQAYGKPTPDSDVDLLVVMPFEGSYFKKSHEIRMRLGLTLPIDLLVNTPEQLQYRLEIGDSFMQEIVERGKVMYEATDN